MTSEELIAEIQRDEEELCVANSDENYNVNIVNQESNSVIRSSTTNKDSVLKTAPAVFYVDNKQKSGIKSESTQEKTKQDFPLYNKRALSKDASTYELETFEKKVLVIFNQENVIGYETRVGTAKDVEALTKTFECLGFEVTEHKDFTKRQIMNELKSFFDQDFTDIGCIVIAILTHGNEYGMLRAKDRKYSETKITKYLETYPNPTLVTKPKFLIVQSCRGKKTNFAQTVRATYRDLVENGEYTMPSEADLLILRSTFSGYPSFRNALRGSWLIQSLCKHIDVLSDTTDLESIIVAVKKDVAIHKSYVEMNKRTNAKEINKQIPVVTSTLIRKLYLRKFKGSLALNLNCKMMTNDVSQDAETSAPETPNETTSDMPTPGLSLEKRTDLFTKQYFLYLIRCLAFYFDDNPEDIVAQSYLMMANTFGKCKKFDSAKEEMINILCKYFIINKEKIRFYNYLFIKNNEFEDVKTSETNEF